MSKTRKLSATNSIAFRIIGFLTTLYGLALLLLWFANSGARENGGRDLSGMIYLSAYFIPVGIGVFLQRRIFAILISIPTFATALWLITGSIGKVPYPWILHNIGFALILCIPTFFTVRAWKQFKQTANQKLEPTVKTPADSVNVLRTAGQAERSKEYDKTNTLDVLRIASWLFHSLSNNCRER